MASCVVSDEKCHVNSADNEDGVIVMIVCAGRSYCGVITTRDLSLQVGQTRWEVDFGAVLSIDLSCCAISAARNR